MILCQSGQSAEKEPRAVFILLLRMSNSRLPIYFNIYLARVSKILPVEWNAISFQMFVMFALNCECGRYTMDQPHVLLYSFRVAMESDIMTLQYYQQQDQFGWD